MRRFAVLSLLVTGLLAPTCGCFPAIKQAYFEAKGAGGEIKRIDDAGDAALTNIKSVQFKPARTTVSARLCPPKLLDAIDTELATLKDKLAAELPGGPPALTVDVEVIYFQEKGVLSSALCLARVRMQPESGPLIDAIIKSESKSFRAGDEKALARATTQAITRLIRQQLDLPEKEKQKK